MILALQSLIRRVFWLAVWIAPFLASLQKTTAQEQAQENAHSVKKLVEVRGKGMIALCGFSPDGRTLLFTDGLQVDESQLVYQLHEMDLTNGKLARSASFRQGFGSIRSPGGNFLATTGGRPGERKGSGPIIWHIEE